MTNWQYYKTIVCLFMQKYILKFPFLGKLMILRNNFISKYPLTMSNISYWHRYSYVVLYSKEIYESLAMTHKVHELRLKIQIIAYKSE